MQTEITIAILMAIIGTGIGSLVTYFFKSISDNKKMEALIDKMEETINEYDKQHQHEFHKEDARQMVENHAKNCYAVTSIRNVQDDLQTVKVALIYLVSVNGGDLKQLGLVR